MLSLRAADADLVLTEVGSVALLALSIVKCEQLLL